MRHFRLKQLSTLEHASNELLKIFETHQNSKLHNSFIQSSINLNFILTLFIQLIERKSPKTCSFTRKMENAKFFNIMTNIIFPLWLSQCRMLNFLSLFDHNWSKQKILKMHDEDTEVFLLSGKYSFLYTNFGVKSVERRRKRNWHLNFF